MEKFKSVTAIALIAGALSFSAGSETAHAPMNPVASSGVIVVSGSVGIDLN